jgi:hypothetical protein
LKDAGFNLKLEKCMFGVQKLDFVGYTILGYGIQPTAEKVKSLLNAPSPTIISELQAYLGYVNCYERLFPNKSTVFAPLYELLCEKVLWRWTEREEACISYIKRIMPSGAVLKRLNPKLPIVLHCDASPYGVGAVLSHIGGDNLEFPITYTSRVLRGSEKNYVQID